MNIKEKALEVAKKAHTGQTRKADGTPMIAHPIRVAKKLEEAGFSDEVVAGGYLHDTVEDTELTMEQVKSLFGDEVARVVAGNTEDKSKSWEERKQHTIDWIKVAPLEIKALIVADKLDNLTSLVKDYQKQGEKVWSYFKRGKEKQKWYFTSIAKNMYDGLEEKDIPAFFTEYGEIVRSFFG